MDRYLKSSLVLCEMHLLLSIKINVKNYVLDKVEILIRLLEYLKQNFRLILTAIKIRLVTAELLVVDTINFLNLI